MKYVVMYQSKSGNTEKIAEEIYQNLPEWDTDIYDIDKGGEIPLAEVYFIGFGVQRGTCSMEIINLFEKIKGGKIALFATCGSCPTDHYKKADRICRTGLASGRLGLSGDVSLPGKD